MESFSLGATNSELFLDGTSFELAASSETTSIVILIIDLLLSFALLLMLGLNFVLVSVNLVITFIN